MNQVMYQFLVLRAPELLKSLTHLRHAALVRQLLFWAQIDENN